MRVLPKRGARTKANQELKRIHSDSDSDSTSSGDLVVVRSVKRAKGLSSTSTTTSSSSSWGKKKKKKSGKGKGKGKDGDEWVKKRRKIPPPSPALLARRKEQAVEARVAMEERRPRYGHSERLLEGVDDVFETFGNVGGEEKMDDQRFIRKNLHALAWEVAEAMRRARHVVVLTGAGISVRAGIPDARSEWGDFSMAAKAIDPNAPIHPMMFPKAADPAPLFKKLEDAIPTYAHVALSTMVAEGAVDFLVSSNIDGLHLRAGTNPHKLAEVHGNAFKHLCSACGAHYVGAKEIPTSGYQPTGRDCILCGAAGSTTDSCPNLGDPLPSSEYRAAVAHTRVADLVLVLGSSLESAPMGDLVDRALRLNGRRAFPARLIIVNAQKTSRDAFAALRIGWDVQQFLFWLVRSLGLDQKVRDRATGPSALPFYGWVHPRFILPLAATHPVTPSSGLPTLATAPPPNHHDDDTTNTTTTTT